MRSLGRWALLLLCVASCLFNGCGYNLVGKGGALPPHVKKVSIPIFKNETFESGLEALVTDAVVASFMQRGGLQVGDDSADARLLGTVIGYELKRLSYDSEGIPTEYRIAISVKAELIDLSDNKAIIPSQKFSVEKDYNVTEDVTDEFVEARTDDSRDVRTREESRRKALQMATQDLAKHLVSSMLDTF